MLSPACTHRLNTPKRSRPSESSTSPSTPVPVDKRFRTGLFDTNVNMNESSFSIPDSQNPMQRALNDMDKNAPLTIGVLAQFLQLQTDHLTKAFNEKLIAQSERIDKLEGILNERDRELASVKGELKEIRERQDDSDQYSRRNSIRISGITEQADEDSDTVARRFIRDKLHITLSDSDFCRIHRVGNPRLGNRQLLIKLTNFSAKRKLLRARKTLRENGGNVFITEDLTKQRAALAFRARQLKKNKVVIDTWTFDGKIFIKTRDNKVMCFTSTEKLLGYFPVHH